MSSNGFGPSGESSEDSNSNSSSSNKGKDKEKEKVSSSRQSRKSRKKKERHPKTFDAILDKQTLMDQKLDLAEFKQGRIVGTGTFGRVCLAQSSATERWYALKVLRKEDVVRLKQVEHVIAEKNILASVTHPFIVNMVNSFKDDDNLYMLMEFVCGGELFTHLRRAGRFHNDVAKFYASCIVLVFEYLHDNNIVYRDLKPENVLLDEKGYVKVTDFGFAKKVVDRTWTLCGTPEYIAPEIIQSKGHNKAVDWWSLGILIYEMLAGYPPFYDDNPFGIYEKILVGRFSFPSHFDVQARDLVRRLLTADRTKRLGNLKKGARDVENHRWFRRVDWNALLERTIDAPIIPPYKYPGDAGNYDDYEDEEVDTSSSGEDFGELFDDF